MLYATVCYGSKFIERYNYEINQVGLTNTVYVLTDYPESFPNCITRSYEQFMGTKTFSYYSKILFLFSLLEELKERVNYVDADFLRTSFNKELVVDGSTLFTSVAINYNKTLLGQLDLNRDKYREWYKFLKEVNLETEGDNVFTYVTEAFWSFPYLGNMKQIASRARELKNRIEEIFTLNPAHWKGTPLSRYAKTGIGFGEGTAMSVLVQEFNIPLNAVNHNKDLFNKKKFHIL
jgi:hypothetical protein